MCHLGVLILNPLPFYSRPTYSPQTAFKKLLASQAVWALQHIRIQKPFFSLPLRGSVRTSLPWSPEVTS